MRIRNKMSSKVQNSKNAGASRTPEHAKILISVFRPVTGEIDVVAHLDLPDVIPGVFPNRPDRIPAVRKTISSAMEQKMGSVENSSS